MGIRQDQYYDLNGSATWLKRLLYLSLLMILAVALSIFAELRLIEAIANGDFASDDEMMQAAATNDARQRIIAIISLIVFISASVQTLIWIYRSAHNARVRESSMEYTPASCVWWYFVPIAMLWKPYGAMREIWRAFATQAGRPPDTGRGLLILWWAIWIISNLLNQVSLRLTLRADDGDSIRFADRFDLFTMPFGVASTLVFVSLVNGLMQLQRESQANRDAQADALAPQTPDT